MLLSDVCLSVFRVHRANSRIERPRKTKIGKEVAHVTRDSDITFKVKWSKVKVTRPLYSPRVGASGSCSCSGERMNVLAVRNCCYIAVCSAALRCPRERRGAGAYRGGRPPTACLSSQNVIHSDSGLPLQRIAIANGHCSNMQL